jgi:hypothetical protein
MFGFIGLLDTARDTFTAHTHYCCPQSLLAVA